MTIECVTASLDSIPGPAAFCCNFSFAIHDTTRPTKEKEEKELLLHS
jgi:hypothetical protein